MNEADLLSLDRHSEEMSEGIWIGVWSVFAEPLLVISTLNEVDGLLSSVRSRVEASCPIKIHAKVVPSSLCKKFEFVAIRVVSPDILPQKRIAWRGLVQVDPHPCGHRASRASVEPSVGPEFQAVGDGMGVLKVKS